MNRQSLGAGVCFLEKSQTEGKVSILLSALSVSLLVCFPLWMQRRTGTNWVVEYQKRLSHFPWPAPGSDPGLLGLLCGTLRSFGGVSEEFQGWGLP